MSYTIGQLARLSGPPVKTIRSHSDIGVLPERGRTRSGYRLYDDFRASLREMGGEFRERAGELDPTAWHEADILITERASAGVRDGVARILALIVDAQERTPESVPRDHTEHDSRDTGSRWPRSTAPPTDGFHDHQ
ncbi:MerR family DNA-binding transcriptional regulator [Streptosporangium amethystogenes subsp. fukuiense]|uniref:MerR family DNA-binding transcriptional regulator n=1 Tax=Streptosporangium amethystogenes subsp. fukuiense TaxID=698418 RepID=A0ABW2T7I7_9ACTN